MPLDKNKILRYQVLDRCFRDTSRLYKVTDLLDCCNQEMRRYDYRYNPRYAVFPIAFFVMQAYHFTEVFALLFCV